MANQILIKDPVTFAKISKMLTFKKKNRVPGKIQKEEIVYVFNASRTNGLFEMRVPFNFPNFIRENSSNVIEKIPFLRSKKEISPVHEIVLRQHQKNVFNQSLDFLLRGNSVLLNCSTGFGKTSIAIALLCELKKKALFITPTIALRDQLFLVICERTKNCSVLLLKSPSDFKHVSTHDVVVVSQHMFRSYTQFKTGQKQPLGTPATTRRMMDDFDVIFMDEMHKLLTNTVFSSILYCCPLYLIGMTATKWTTYDADFLFDWFFTKTVKFSVRQTFIYIAFDSMQSFQGTYNEIINQQTKCETRNQILSLATDFFSRCGMKFLFGSGRVAHTKLIFGSLGQSGANLFIEDNKLPGKEGDVVATRQKVTEGFDCPDLRVLILGSNSKSYFQQYAGRVVREQGKPGIIFDLFEKSMNRHLVSRLRELTNENNVIVISTNLANGKFLNGLNVDYLNSVFCGDTAFDVDTFMKTTPKSILLDSSNQDTIERLFT
jgi:hypothetical protein